MSRVIGNDRIIKPSRSGGTLKNPDCCRTMFDEYKSRCLVSIVPLENFSLVWRRQHYRWRAANFGPCSALMTIELWRFFSMPHLLWRRASVYNGHLREPVTLTTIAEHLAFNTLFGKTFLSFTTTQYGTCFCCTDQSCIVMHFV